MGEREAARRGRGGSGGEEGKKDMSNPGAERWRD